MTEIKRTARAQWVGTSREGNGEIWTASGALTATPYTWANRFESAPGTNPEELVAAAHAACYSMALASTLHRHGYTAERIETNATVVLNPVRDVTAGRSDLPPSAEHADSRAGHRITRVVLQTTARVPGLDRSTFEELAQEAEWRCPISNALRGTMDIQLVAALA